MSCLAVQFDLTPSVELFNCNGSPTDTIEIAPTPEPVYNTAGINYNALDKVYVCGGGIRVGGFIGFADRCYSLT